MDEAGVPLPTIYGVNPWLTIPEACIAMRIGRTKFYELERDGHITVLRFGARRVVPAAELVRLTEEMRRNSGKLPERNRPLSAGFDPDPRSGRMER